MHADDRVVKRSISALEVAGTAAYLALLAALVFGRHVLDGGFHSDDWGVARTYEFADSPRLLGAISEEMDLLGSRPLLATLLPLPHAVFGLHPEGHLALAAVLGVATCLCFYLFLRALPLAPVHAWAMAGLALVFPFADSIRLWSVASLNTAALCFAFLGAFVALRGITRDGRSSVVALALSSVLYAASVLTYEVAGAALLLSGALYLGRTERRKALRWWAIQAMVVVGALVYTALTTAKEVGGISDRLSDVPTYTRQAIALFSLSFVPADVTGTAPRAAGVLVAAAVVVVGVWRYRASRGPVLGFWLVFVAGSMIAIGTAYLITVGAFLDPIKPGLGNRGNIFAAFGFVSLLYGIAMIGLCLLAGRPAFVKSVVVGVLALIAVGYIVRVEDDAAAWDRAARLQEPALERVVDAASTLPPGSTVFTFGWPAQVSDGIPIFYVDWDLDGALAVRAGNRFRHAYPVYDRATFVCAPRAVSVQYPEFGSTAFAGYRRAFFLDVPTGRLERVTSRAACVRARATFRPGALQAPPGFSGS